MRWVAVVASLGLVACSGGGGDLLTPDAAAVDAAAVDAAAIDAAAIDAAAIDASAIDAPAVDAFDPDASLAPWPPPTTLPVHAAHLGVPTCVAVGLHTYTWLANLWGLTGHLLYLMQETDVIHSSSAMLLSGACSMSITRDQPPATVQAAFVLEEIWTVRLSTGESTSLPAPTLLVAADPAGGMLLVDGTDLLRLTATLTVDPGFGTAGRLPIAATPAAYLVGGPSTGAWLTAAIASQLVRISTSSGAPVAAFGGGSVTLPCAPADLLALAPLPGDGVAVIGRGPGPAEVTIYRIDSTGTAQAGQVVDLGLPPVHAHEDASGRVTFSFDEFTEVMRLTRIWATTGALDTSFGTGGRATVTVTMTDCPGGYVARPGWGWAWRASLGDGRQLFSASKACGEAGGHAYPADWGTTYLY